MRKKLNMDEMKYIIGSVMKYAYESIDDEKKEPGEFNEGRKLAYQEVLNTIYNQLGNYKQNQKEFGYSEDWEKPFFEK